MVRSKNNKVKNRKRNPAKIAGYMLLSLVFIGSLSLLLSLRVESKTQAAILFDNGAYEEAEQIYKKAVKGVLETYECYNSGLNLTRTVDISGEREYCMEIHNQKFHLLSRKEMEQLRQEIENMVIAGPGGSSVFVEVVFTGGEQ